MLRFALDTSNRLRVLVVPRSWVVRPDGTIGVGEAVVHTYVNRGTYTVTLTVTDDGGLSDSATKSVRVGKGRGECSA